MQIKKATDLKRNKDWRIMVYAKPGTGKTSLVQYLKGKTLVLDMDDSSKVLAGLPNVDVISFDRVHPDEFITEFLKEASQLIKEYDNLVIDNISSFERDWFVELGRKSKNGISNEIQDYSKWTNYFARVMTTLYMLKDINILVTAWEMLEDYNGDTGQSLKRYAPRIRDSVRDGLLGLTDVVGRVTINPKTGGRGVILEGDDGIYAKNRLDDRKLVAAEHLFDIGGDAIVSTPSAPDKTSESSKE
ncbi:MULTISPECIES: AAA family ATPase [Enterococcus]|uniref:AAA family ATPase n=1 Tax=Enterococcus TaxID=1350 RepID=UPI00189C9B2F|nr:MULTISPECIES: AAA family ATPase [Enterococcus]MDB1684991.1 AAA family ATPase [Enterococcus durans]MDT2670120.1 AAA family ATPase [Enterococcus dongliensis]